MGIALDNFGHLYVVNYGNKTIEVMIRKATGTCLRPCLRDTGIMVWPWTVPTIFMSPTIMGVRLCWFPIRAACRAILPVARHWMNRQGWPSTAGVILLAANSLGGWIEKFDPLGQGTQFANPGHDGLWPSRCKLVCQPL